MGFNARVIRVLIACPGDVEAERDAVVDTLLRWDSSRAEGAGLLFLPRHWKIGAVPQLTGSDGQTVINEQLVQDADVVIAVFYSRMGAATPRAASGTAEELQHARDAGKPVHVWFSRAGLPPDVDAEQLLALRAFKKSLEGVGLYGEYDDIGDLQLQVTSALELDAGRFAGEALGEEVVRPRSPRVEGVRLIARYEKERELKTDSRGKQSYTTRNQRIVVANDGDATAQQVRLVLEGSKQQAPPQITSDAQPNIAGHTEYTFPVITAMQMSRDCTLRMLWSDGTEDHEVSQSIFIG